MKEAKEYASQWDISAKYFYDKNYYAWMAEKLDGYNTVVEVGCGTGYSTLALAEKGFKVLAIDKNAECIEKVKILLHSNGISGDQVIFLEGDIVDPVFREYLISSYIFDIVICWNIGTYWYREMMEFYVPYMFEYGLDVEQIKENPESSYSELIIWETMRLAKAKHIPVYLIDRGTKIINEHTDPYYYRLKDEFEYSEITYDNLSAVSLSNGGRILTTNGIVNTSRTIDIIFISIFIK